LEDGLKGKSANKKIICSLVAKSCYLFKKVRIYIGKIIPNVTKDFEFPKKIKDLMIEELETNLNTTIYFEEVHSLLKNLHDQCKILTESLSTVTSQSNLQIKLKESVSQGFNIEFANQLVRLHLQHFTICYYF
jgi:hypothetical protein